MPFGVDLPGGGQIKSALGEVKHQVLRPLVWEENTLGKPLAEGFNTFQKDIDKLPNQGLRDAARVAFGVAAAGTLGTLAGVATLGNPLAIAAGIGTGAALAHPKSSGAASSLLLPSSLIGFGMPGAALKSAGLAFRGLSLLEDAAYVPKYLSEAEAVSGAAYKATDIARFGVNLEKWGTKLMEAEQKAVGGATKLAAYPVYKPLQKIWQLGGIIPRSAPALAQQLKTQAAGVWMPVFGDPTITRASDLPKMAEDLIYRVKSGGEISQSESTLVSMMTRLKPADWEGQLRNIVGQGTPVKALDYLRGAVSKNPMAMKDVLAMPKTQAAWEAITKPLQPYADQWVKKAVPIMVLPSKAMLEFGGYSVANDIESLLHMFQLDSGGATGFGVWMESMRDALGSLLPERARALISKVIPGITHGERPATQQVVNIWKNVPGVPETIRSAATSPLQFVMPEMGFGKGFFRRTQGAFTKGIDLMTFNRVAPYEITNRLPASFLRDVAGEIPTTADPELQWELLHTAATKDGKTVLKFLENVSEKKVAESAQSGALSAIFAKNPILSAGPRNELAAARDVGWKVDPDILASNVGNAYRKDWQTIRAAEPSMVAVQLQGIAQEAQAAIDAGTALTPEQLDDLWRRWKATETLAGGAAENADKAITETARTLPGKTRGEQTARTAYFTAAHGHMMQSLTEMDAARQAGLNTLLSVPGAADRTAATLGDMNTAWDAVRQSWSEWKAAKDEFFTPGGKFFSLRKADNEKFWAEYQTGMLGAWDQWRNTAMPIYNNILAAAAQGTPAELAAAMQTLPGVAAQSTSSLLAAKAEAAAQELERDVRSLFTADPRYKDVADQTRDVIKRYATIADTVPLADKKQAADAIAYGVKKGADVAHMISIDASNLTIADSFFRSIGLPFFSYEARRFPRMASLVMARPGIARNLYKFFTDASDEGYIHIPGTPMDASLFRMLGLGPLRSMQQPYWPPEHSGFMGMLERTSADMTKFGFFPVSLQLLTAAGTGQPQQLLPPALESVSAALELIPKGVPIVGGIRLAEILPSFFNTDSRQAYMKAQLIDMGIDPATATEDDVDKARKSVNLALLASAQIGITRFKPEMIRKITDVRGEVAAKYGVPADTIKLAQQAGRNPIYATDANKMPYLNKAQADSATDEAAATLGVPPEAVRAVSDIWVQIRPQKQQKASAFYDALTAYDKSGEENQLSAPAQSVLEGKALPYEWRTKRTEYYAYRNLVRQKLLAENGLTEADLKYAPNAPKRPEDVLAEQYNAIDPDADADGIITAEEWTAYDAKTKAFLADCTPAQVDYIKADKTMPWKDPNNINLETRLRRARDVVQTLFDTPKYLGIPVEVQDKIDAVTQQEADFHYQLRAKGMLSTAQLPNNDAVWAAFANYLSRTNPTAMPYFALANKMRNTKFRAALQNPERLDLLYRNSDVLAFYPDLAQSLSDDERLILGIGARAGGEEGILQKWAKTLKSGAAS
jgi:hypothetical protein